MTVPYTHIDKLYIGGRWVAPSRPEREPVLNPSTEEVVGMAPVGTLAEAHAAMAAAREAFDSGPWPGLPQAERTAVMRRLYDALLSREEAIAALETATVGLPALIGRKMVWATAVEAFEHALERSLQPGMRFQPLQTAVNVLHPDGPRHIGASVVVRDPVGVVTGITGFNAPVLLNLSKIVPALLMGNTLVLKPSPFTPFQALLFGEIAEQIGLPPGVLNIITGGPEVGQAISSDPRVDMISFTGSDSTGAALMAQAAPTLKRMHMELGGKSAMIIRADADLQKAAMDGLANISVMCGQGCALATRHLVHNSIRAQYVEMVKAMSPIMKLGNPALDPAVMVGPLIRQAQRERVERYVALGRDEGAKLVMGGGRPADLKKGFFHEVTLFDDVDNRMRIAQEEIFGPVGCVIGFDTDEQAIRIANDTRYGLMGSIHTADAETGFRMALRMRTGGVFLNGGSGKHPDAPFGGIKRSGMGREYGDRWLDEYTSEKTIAYPIGR
jgi:acyl-CoA reductase-like NAD-dependent aldehyde dehydrogenase